MRVVKDEFHSRDGLRVIIRASVALVKRVIFNT